MSKARRCKWIPQFTASSPKPAIRDTDSFSLKQAHANRIQAFFLKQSFLKVCVSQADLTFSLRMKSSPPCNTWAHTCTPTRTHSCQVLFHTDCHGMLELLQWSSSGEAWQCDEGPGRGSDAAGGVSPYRAVSMNLCVLMWFYGAFSYRVTEKKALWGLAAHMQHCLLWMGYCLFSFFLTE